MTGEDEDGRLGAVMRGAGTPDPGEGTLMEGLPFSRDIGMRLHSAGDGVALLSVPYDARLVGDPQTGVMHGGVITALLDTACGSAVMAAPAKLRSTATLDLRIDYMRPAQPGKRVMARAECYRMTRTIGFARAVAYHDTPEDPIASAAGTFILDRVARETGDE
ncbi:PaaI family thioesterase [Limibaculum sp. FT325]|uniref:PaaI family thioesterase n=1 Tax=Thermohalobaculum sediminis TaxID=2939436 RepID=UPI0020C0A295|nr:PaaI family thioesterase [Limibaculum sediminis]MCL5777728.1 PaaI family thioesterase [Limibaculum sediminis]